MPDIILQNVREKYENLSSPQCWAQVRLENSQKTLIFTYTDTQILILNRVPDDRYTINYIIITIVDQASEPGLNLTFSDMRYQSAKLVNSYFLQVSDETKQKVRDKTKQKVHDFRQDPDSDT